VSALCFALLLLGFGFAVSLLLLLLKPAAGATPRSLLIIAFVSTRFFLHYRRIMKAWQQQSLRRIIR
jgi:hypothetical protein